jgi:MFS transporter, DHA3 family, macrolide efflux protein
VISGPLGAVALQILPVYGVLMIDVGTAMIAILPLLFIPIPQPQKRALQGEMVAKTSVWQDFKEGLQFVFTWPGLLFLIVIASIVNLVMVPGFSLLPILVNKYFGGGALQLGWMQSAFGFGIIAGGVLLSIWGGFKRRVVTSLIGLVGFGLGAVFLGLIPPQYFLVAVALAFWIGFVTPISNGPLMAAVQAVVDPGIQGRVFTLINSSVGAMSPLGLLIAGPFADRYGVQYWYIIGGVVTLLMAVIAFLIPPVVNIDAGKRGAIVVEAASQTPSD